MKRTIELTVLLLVGGLVMRTWCIQGLVVPLVVPSGSMAQTLLGPHRDVTCRDCGFRFTCGADDPPSALGAICPNCGCDRNDVEGLPEVAGDRVVVAKSIFRIRPPRRWEVVAFRLPQQASQIGVKRVVGLPGERVQIRHGDVYADGAIQRKPWAAQRAMAVLVHDAACRPVLQPQLPSRWQSDSAPAQWSWSEGRFTHPAAAAAPAIDWLGYHHWRRVPGAPGQVEETPIRDLYAYNQARPRRVEDIHPVTDLLLSFRLLGAAGPGRLWVRGSDGREEIRVRIEPDELRYEVFRSGQGDRPLATGPLPGPAQGLLVEVSLFDQQFVLALGGRAVCEVPFEPAERSSHPTSRPFGIGSEGLEVELGDVRVYRDVYYTHPLGPDGRWALKRPVLLGEDEYFVLGDNSPISEDSRTWVGGPGVPAKFLIGKPLAVHLPARPLDLGPWHFQVPDPARIRYIR